MGKKDKVIRVRVSVEEYESVKAISTVTGITMSELLRRLLKEKSPKIIEGLSMDELKSIVRTITAIGNLQKKIDNELLEILSNNFEVDIDVFTKFREHQDELRGELLGEIKEVKGVLLGILSELR